MTRFSMLFGGVLALAACQMPAVTGGVDSAVGRLAVGMSLQEAMDALGATTSPAVFEGDGVFCETWVYNEAVAAEYIHARFRNGALISARDGFDAPCPAA